MAGYPDPTEPYGPAEPYGPQGPAEPPRPAGPPRLNAGRLWSAGLATAVVAALVALVGVLIVRALLRIDVYASRAAGAFGDSTTVMLCVGAAVAALAATGLAHLLLLSTPRPLAYLSWIIGLVTAVAVVLPLASGTGLAVALATSVIHLVIGIAIGSLVSGAAGSALRSAALTNRPIDLQ
jgi:hypothetical protein